MSATPGPPAPPPGPPTQKVSDVITTFRPSRKFKPGDSKTSVTSLDFDDSGELAIVARDDDTLQIYNCKEGKHAKELKSQKYGVHLARFSHHAQSIIYASTKIDDTIRFLSVHDNSFIRYFKGHSDTVTNIALCPANDTFISCSRDNTVRIWDLASQSWQGLLKLHAPYLAAYDPSASVIAIASPPTHAVLLYDIRNYDKPPFATFDLMEMEQRFLGAQGGDWTKLDFTNDGKSLVVSTTGNGHFVLDAFSGELTHFCYRKAGHSGRLAPGASPPGQTSGMPNGLSPALGQGDVCATPDGQYLLGGSGQDSILVWDISKPPSHNNVLEPFETLPGMGKAPIVGYNPRTNLLASADRDFFFWQPDPDLMLLGVQELSERSEPQQLPQQSYEATYQDPSPDKPLVDSPQEAVEEASPTPTIPSSLDHQTQAERILEEWRALRIRTQQLVEDYRGVKVLDEQLESPDQIDNATDRGRPTVDQFLKNGTDVLMKELEKMV